MAFEAGTQAPDFSLENPNGELKTLASYTGQYLVIYFYSKDNTPRCTKQACTFRANIAAFPDKNVAVVGVSKDSAKTHSNFIAKFELPFDLLVDKEIEMMPAYDCWKEKKNYGKTYMGCVRSTILIDPQGKVIKHWDTVKKAETHPLEVLELVNSL